MANLSWEEIRQNSIRFSKRWSEAKNEAAEAQIFVHELLNAFGTDSRRVATFEFKVPQGATRNGYIDMLWKGRILIEMKSRGKSLDRAFKQANDYAFSIVSDEDLPEYIMVCDFEKIRLYRLTTGQQWEFKTKDLSRNIKKLSILTAYASKYDFVVDRELNTQAAYMMAELHDNFKAAGYTGHSLEVYLVRLLFCLFADDSGLFQKHQFYSFVMNSKPDGSDLAGRISTLFAVLNTPKNERQRTLHQEYLNFEYVNGGLFEETLTPAGFDRKMYDLLMKCCEFDWSNISPSIFGSMFQGVMNQFERRNLGAHYTSEQNILKVIKPLFLDDLWAEFERLKGNNAQLEAFHKKIASLRFLDPACGCGNFLVVVYRELRLLELEILKMQINDANQLQFGEMLKDRILVSVSQFYGIEYSEFPGQIAQVAMWLMDHLMNNLVADHFGLPFPELPIKESASIHRGTDEGNALLINWEQVIPKQNLSYILGNPPFNGARTMSEQQKSELATVFNNAKGTGDLDYVTCWYKLAADYIKGTMIRAAFVSTNSIAQGVQPAVLWKHLQGIKIDFAYRTFKWSNDAKGKAAVHCVIIGFSPTSAKSTAKLLFDGTDIISATNINPYLIDAPSVLIESRTKPLCDVPMMGIGNKPIDGGNYLFTEEEKDAFVKLEPQSEKWFRPWIGAHEFINRYHRYCLWLGDCPPSDLRKMPEAMKRIEAVRAFRVASKSPGTQKLADVPRRFHVENIPTSTYIVVPEVSSERRRYIPIGFLSPDVLCSNLVRIIPNASLYHFGILTSNVHMAWTRAVCGRLKSDYRYSIDIVYNNFPWPEATEEQKDAIAVCAKDILTIREQFSTSSLADLYDPLTTPPELLKAHTKLNRAVWKAYKANWANESECVADLMQRYMNLLEPQKQQPSDAVPSLAGA